MILAEYTIDFQEVFNFIKKNDIRTILVQLPEGLKQYSTKIKDEIKKIVKGDIIFSADPCYGACDLPYIEQLEVLDIQAVIQIGHTIIPSMKKALESKKIPVFFIPAYSTIDIEGIVKDACKFLRGNNIGIVTTAQHIHKLDQIEKILLNQGFYPIISDGDERIAHKGQILGCNFSSSRSSTHSIDSYLYIGGGMFHPLGLMLSTKKQVVLADPYENKIKIDELAKLKDKILRQRYAAITHAKYASRFGIILCSKYGQQRKKTAEKIKNILNDENKQSMILLFDFINPVSLQNYMDIDCFILTACPRIVIDDFTLYKKPIITPIELEIALNKRKFDDYCFDEIHE